MSTNKVVTSKKRKLADTDHDVVASQERPTTAHRSLKRKPAEVFSTASALAQAPTDGGFEIVSDLESEKRKTKHSPRKLDNNVPDTAEITEEGSQVGEDAGNKETADHLRRPKPRDKAASRQAKSERRSKKKQRKSDPAPATDLSSHPEPAFLVPDQKDQTQEPSERPQLSEHTSSTHPSQPDPKQRFIVFIGNLPYTASTSAIRSHFSKLAPFTVRHSTDRSTGRSRGFAFLEFEGYDRMKTCLKLYHHSLFGAGGQPSSGTEGRKGQTRKINVELTAGGGGGKSTARREKIRGKNEKLEGERERLRLHREKEEAAAKRKEKKMELGGDKTGANAVEITNAEPGPDGDLNIHPSRRKKMGTHHC